MAEMAAPKLTRKELIDLLTAEFPEASHALGAYEIEEVWLGGCRVRRPFHQGALRPGGTISGPVMMAVADFTMYVAVLSAVGWVPLAVTTNLNINLIKLGKRLVVGEVTIRSDGEEDLVAHVTSTYSVPPQS
jgi:acyl-coenzyme A thioesterase PaaI-like protein